MSLHTIGAGFAVGFGSRERTVLRAASPRSRPMVVVTTSHAEPLRDFRNL